MAIDSAELRRVIESHQRMVFSIAMRLTGDYGLAEEVAQDVFLDFCRSGEKLTSNEHVRFWLRRVAVHRATDALRHRSRQPEAAAEKWVPDEHDAPLGQIGGAPVSSGVSAKIEELLLAIPEPLRVVMVMRYPPRLVPVSRLSIRGLACHVPECLVGATRSSTARYRRSVPVDVESWPRVVYQYAARNESGPLAKLPY